MSATPHAAAEFRRGAHPLRKLQRASPRAHIQGRHVCVGPTPVPMDTAAGSDEDTDISLMMAAVYGQVDIVQALLAGGRADPAASDSFSLTVAAEGGHATIVAALLTDGRADPAANRSRALRDAASGGHTEAVRALLADGRADPAAIRSCALRYAARCGHTGVVCALLADGRANPAAKKSLALQYAARDGRTEVVAALLADGRVNSAVLATARGRHAEAVTRCLARHACWLQRRPWLRASLASAPGANVWEM
jgi:hypothetical protein